MALGYVPQVIISPPRIHFTKNAEEEAHSAQAAFAHQVVHGMRCRGQVINRCIAYREATNANIARVELTYGKLKNAFHPRS